MAEGLEVTIRYRGAKYVQVATPATPSSEFAILKKDLAHLRVHSPSQKNVRRVNGSFVLHWPNAGTSLKVASLADSLHTRWIKLCSDDPEALKLREFLSIESITLRQDGILIRSTAGAEQGSQDVPGTLAERLAGPLPETLQQPVTAPIPSPSKLPPPPRVPPTIPRLDRQPPTHLKRRMSSDQGPSNQTRQKRDVPESPTTPTDPPPPTDAVSQPIALPVANQRPSPSIPEDAMNASPQPTTQNEVVPSVNEPMTTPPPPPSREAGEMTPRPASGPSNTGPSSGPGSELGLGSGPAPVVVPEPESAAPAPVRAPITPPSAPTTPPSAPPAPPGPSARPPPALLPPHHLTPGSPYASSSSSGNGESWARRRDRDRDVNRLTRELWDTRRQLTAMHVREQAILDDLERLGVRPESSSSNGGSGSGGADRNAVMRLETDVRAERARRLRAERALSDVERECAAPFVVPALFQAFMSISELSN